MNKKQYVNRFDNNPELACYCQSGRAFGDCCGSTRDERPPPKGVIIVHNFLSAAECRRLVRFADKQSARWLMINDPEKSTPQRPVVKKDPARVTQVVQMRKHQSFIDDTIRKGLRLHAVPQFGSFDWFEMPYLLRYKIGGKYAPHADADQLDPATGRLYRAADRDISALLYLNDDYVGGELTFTNLHYTLRPQAGDLVIFPSGIRYRHAAHAIESGRKYALVTWASLRSSPKLFPQASHSPRISP